MQNIELKISENNKNKFDSNTDDPYNRRFYKLEKTSLTNDLQNFKKCGMKYFSELKNNLKRRSFYKSILYKRLPIVQWLFIEYQFKLYLLNDIISGFTVGIMNIPQSMAYALLANLPPVHGLYMSFFPLFAYAIFGTSKHVAIGKA